MRKLALIAICMASVPCHADEFQSQALGAKIVEEVSEAVAWRARALADEARIKELENKLQELQRSAAADASDKPAKK